MDIEKKFTCIEQNKMTVCEKTDVDLDYQETLPAYLDDVYRVIKCSSTLYITAIDINFNEIKVYGKAFITLTYYNDSSSLSYADFEEDFHKSITVDGLSENAFVFADIVSKYTSFRVINQRRIDVHVSAFLRINVYDKNSCPCICECANSRLKTETVSASDIINSCITKIEFDEEIQLTADSGFIKRIISYNAFSTLNDIKIIKDKALIKADVSISVLYTSDSGEEELKSISYSFSVSKIFELPGINENDIIIPDIRVCNVFLKAKNKASDKLETVNAYGDIYVNCIVIRENEKSLITDAYALNKSYNTDNSDCEIMTDGKYINETKQLTLTYKLNSDIKQLKELTLNIVSADYKNTELKLKTEIEALAFNISGELTLQSSASEDTLTLSDNEYGFVNVSIESYDYTLSEKTVNVRVALKITAYTYNLTPFSLVSDIESTGEEIEMPTLTVYFGSKGEKLWDISKKFLSDSDLIRAENALKGDALENDKVLIIPKVREAE